MLNTAWTRLLLPLFVTHEVIEVCSVNHPFMFTLWISDFCYCSTLRMHTLQSEKVEFYQSF